LPANCNTDACSLQIQAKHQGICPENWHIPSNEEWATLEDYVGSTGGTKLKAASGWDTPSYMPAGKDIYGFAALPGGSGSLSGFNYSFFSIGNGGYWLSSTESCNIYTTGCNNRGSLQMGATTETVFRPSTSKIGLHSVRCLKD
jgi:uncharacterized protein (TIGR02145 family)